MTLNYMGCCKTSKGRFVRIASRICGPAEGVTVITGQGRRFALTCTRFHFLSPLLRYLALTLLRGNLLINLQLVSAARRLINRRRVARWRHAQNPPSASSRRDLYALSLNARHPARDSTRLSNFIRSPRHYGRVRQIE